MQITIFTQKIYTKECFLQRCGRFQLGYCADTDLSDMRARAVLLLATAATLVVCQAQDLRNSINTRARRVRVRVPLTTTTEAVPPEDEPSGGRRTRVRLVGRKRVNSPQPPSEQPPRVPQRNDDQSNGRVKILILQTF